MGCLFLAKNSSLHYLQAAVRGDILAILFCYSGVCLLDGIGNYFSGFNKFFRGMGRHQGGTEEGLAFGYGRVADGGDEDIFLVEGFCYLKGKVFVVKADRYNGGFALGIYTLLLQGMAEDAGIFLKSAGHFGTIFQ